MLLPSYAITDGNYDLGRDLLIKDLEIKHPYNTYYIKGLPPGPISYVGKKTMELIYENYKSNYLYYFYNNIERKHIYSETYDEHRRKLSEYRNKNKIIIISSPSGAGKTTLCKMLLKKTKNIILSISYTSRSKRLNEVDGKDYYFVSKEKFSKLKK